MNMLSRTLFPALALGLLTAVSHGGTISDITITNNGLVTGLKPGYSLFEALNFQGVGSVTRSGITFTNENMTDGVDNTLGIATIITLGTGGSLQTADIGSATDPLFFTETWNQGGSGLKLTLSNLDPAKTYFFEVYHGEPRTCCQPGIFAQDSFIDGATNYPIPSYQLGNGIVDSAPNDRWTISATVSGVSTFSYNTPNGTGRGSSIDGYQLQVVPEPTSAALLLAGGMLALRRRRQIA